MSRTTPLRVFALLAVCGLLGACAAGPGCGRAKAPQPATPVVEDVAPEPSVPLVVVEEPEPPPDYAVIDGRKVALDNEGNPLRDRVLFELNEYDIDAGDFGVLQKHAQNLIANRYQTVTIEGHCDERGTREYNLALGQRRGNAVQEFLLANGVRQSQMEVISYGEERPVNGASTEAAWAQNRRVELYYK